MVFQNGYEFEAESYEKQSGNVSHTDSKPTYALEHLATFKVKNEAEIRNPKDKMKILIELDKSGGIWPQKMYMCFSAQWLVMLDSDMKEIENFPGSLVTEPTAFISDDPLETFNNILIFTVPGVSLGNTEMHIFQVTEVSAVHLVEDLKQLSSGQVVTIDRNKTPIELPKSEKPVQNGKDQYGLAVAAAGVAAERNAHEREQLARDIQVLNHCFEDIERFVTRLQYAAEALHELESHQNDHNPHGEGLLVLRSRPPIESEFSDILAKIKLSLNYIVKLQNHFSDASEAIHNTFISLQTIVNVCNDVHIGVIIPENVVNPLLRRETVTFLSSCLNAKETEFWQSLGTNWTLPKDQFKDHKGSFHPIFYDDWSPDWVVDEDVPYLPPAIKRTHPQSPMAGSKTWLSRLESRNVKIALAQYSKIANNDKELSVAKGEFLEVIDDSRNWWKVRNANGNIGYVPHTILTPHNFEVHNNYSYRDTDSLTSSVLEQEINNKVLRNTYSTYLALDRESQQMQQTQHAKNNMPRSISMPNVPVPPPMPPSESQPNTPSGTLQRNLAAAGVLAAIRARADTEDPNETLMKQNEINEELRMTLLQREKRRDLEIMTTPQIYINQKSTAKEVEVWLRGKGFSDNIVNKLHNLNGAELFRLSPHVIEGYFGQKDSRRLISQIVLQKNICEYKTIRSSELSAKLAKARQKVDERSQTKDEIF